MKLVVDLHDEVYNNMVVKNEYKDMDIIAVHNALMGAILIQKGHGKVIDAESLFKLILDHAYPIRCDCNSIEQGMSITGIIQCINESPTIIDADTE